MKLRTICNSKTRQSLEAKDEQTKLITFKREYFFKQ